MRAVQNTVNRWGVAAGLAVTCGLFAVVPAQAADAGYDSVSDMVLATACGTHDDMSIVLSFHVDAGPDTPASGRVEHIDVDGMLAPLSDYPFHWVTTLYPSATEPYFTEDPAEALPYFESGDYSIDLSWWFFPLSTQDSDNLTLTARYSDGGAAGADSTVVSCFTGTEGATVNDFEITARVGVPRDYRLLEHVMYGGLGEDSASQTWVQSPGQAWNANGRDADALDDLVLDPATSTALGATLSDDAVLTIDATVAGDYTLEWGMVTSPDGDWNWGGGYGDIWGPATLIVHVIDAPVLPSDASLTDEARGALSAPPLVAPGGTAAVDLGDEAAGTYVDVWMRSDPTYLGLMQVGPDGIVNISVPTTLAQGDHRIVVTDEIGGLVGWTGTRVSGAQSLAATGPDARGLWSGALAASGLILVGSTALLASAKRVGAPR